MMNHRPSPLYVLLASLAIAAFPLLADAQAADHPAAPETQSAQEHSASEPAQPTITFLKVFKSSTPEYVEIRIDRQGAGTYDIRQLDDTSRPEPCTVSPALAAKIFSLADELHDFNGVQLDVRRRVANLGEKTFRYDNGSESHQVTFNYTLDHHANELLEIFEGLSLQLQYVAELQRSMRYDPLGLNDVLTRLQSDLHQGLLADPAGLVPILRQISANQRFLDIARQRAELIANTIAPGHGS